MIVLRTPEGLDRARRRSTACRPRARSARTRCRSPTLADNPEHLRAARGVAALLPARGAVRRRRARRAASSPRWRPTGERRMSANPHANGGLLLRDLRAARLPRLRRRRARARRDASSEADARARRASCATSCAPTRETLPRLRARRDRLEPARRRVRGDRPRLGWPRRCPATTTSRPDGRVMEVLTEHLCQGWLEGYLLTGRHGLFNCYEAFIHIVDSMFNQHAKWLKVTRGIPWRRPIASLNYLLTLARLAPGPQRLLPPGPGLHRPRGQQEGRDHPRLPAAGRQLPALGRRPLPAQPRLRQRDRRRQAARAGLPDDGRGDRALHARASASGTGPATTTAASPTSCWPAPATSRRSRRSPPRRCCASTCPSCRCASSTSST